MSRSALYLSTTGPVVVHVQLLSPLSDTLSDWIGLGLRSETIFEIGFMKRHLIVSGEPEYLSEIQSADVTDSRRQSIV